MAGRSQWYAAVAAVALPVLALAAGPGCGQSVGDCVETFQFEGTVVHEGWSQSECDDWCNTVNVGVHLSCYFSGALASPTGPSTRREGPEGDSATPRRS
jgi:hypothetical protein